MDRRISTTLALFGVFLSHQLFAVENNAPGSLTTLPGAGAKPDAHTNGEPPSGEAPPDSGDESFCAVTDDETFAQLGGALQISLYDHYSHDSPPKISANSDGVWLVHGDIVPTKPKDFEGVACKFELKKLNGNSMRLIGPKEADVRVKFSAGNHLELKPPWKSMTCYSGGIGPEFQINDLGERKVNEFARSSFGDIQVSSVLCQGPNKKTKRQK